MTAVESTPAEFPDALPIGTVLGDFTVTKVIGLGGFGIVYMAYDRALQRTVAIKEYLPITIAGRTSAQTVLVRSTHQLDTYTSGLQSFMREARLQARFSHPAMLEVYQVWEQNGTAYMAMRYYPGSSLRDLRHDDGASNLFDEASLRRIMSPVFDALEELHAESVLHRDVSPDNILIMPNGAPVLLDFGSARTVVAGDDQSLTTVLKPGYAPIEQYADDGAMAQGPWTDVYGLGAVLHFLAVGSAPPQAVTRLLGGPLRAFDEEAPFRYSPAFVAAVNSALAVKPQSRLQSVAALRDALGWGNESVGQRGVQTVITPPGSEQPLTGEAPQPVQSSDMSTPPERRIAASRTTVISGALFAVALALGVIGYLRYTRPPPLPPTSAQPNAQPSPDSPAKSLPPATAQPPSGNTPTQGAEIRKLPDADRTAAPKTQASDGGKKMPPVSPVEPGAAQTRARPPVQTAPTTSGVRRDAKADSSSKSSAPAPAVPQIGLSGEPRPTTAICERIFAKLSLGQVALTTVEQRQLPGCW